MHDHLDVGKSTIKKILKIKKDIIQQLNKFNSAYKFLHSDYFIQVSIIRKNIIILFFQEQNIIRIFPYVFFLKRDKYNVIISILVLNMIF